MDNIVISRRIVEAHRQVCENPVVDQTTILEEGIYRAVISKGSIFLQFEEPHFFFLDMADLFRNIVSRLGHDVNMDIRVNFYAKTFNLPSSFVYHSKTFRGCEAYRMLIRLHRR